jgi:predicted AlkP superfamily pyrophosphatase or phosphodiesterase
MCKLYYCNMKRLCLLLSISLFSLVSVAKGPARPKLVVGMVVDQMRWDYLYRYYNGFGSGGFKRLMNEGFRCEQTLINYLPSYTAPGHTSIYTGSVPAIHGIAGNEWLVNGKYHYCTSDNTVMPVGGSMAWGRMSPRTLLATTVTDELRLATNFRSRVYAISLKDRSSIYPGGHKPNGAYWFDDSTGNFCTSTYYTDKLPDWVTRFNARRWADTILSRNWELLDDSSTYTQSTPNNPRYEGAFDKSEVGPGFSHRAGFFKGKGNTVYNSVRKLPMGNWLTFQFAKQCILANDLGHGQDADFLTVSFSPTDYAGHQFGPNAVELEDMYRRFDRELSRFLSFLDDEVGAGEYTIFLTADHGAAHNSLFMEDNRMPAGNVSEGVLLGELNKYLASNTGKSKAVLSLENYQVHIADTLTDASIVLDLAVKWLKARPEVQDAFNLNSASDLVSVPEPIRTMAVNGYHRGRSGPVLYILKPGYYAGYAPTGTTHGTWNPYDTHIPLIWYGWGIRKGQTHREVHMTDIAPTISALLRIQMPSGNVGKVITEIIP